MEFVCNLTSIACCMQLSLKLSKKSPWDTKNEVYWHAREKAQEYAREKIPWSLILIEYNRVSHFSLPILKRESENVGIFLAHPDIIVSEVMEV